MKTFLSGGYPDLLNNGATEYNDLSGGRAWTATEGYACGVIPTDGTLKELYVWLDADPGTDPDAYTFTVRVNGGDSTLTCTIVANNPDEIFR